MIQIIINVKLLTKHNSPGNPVNYSKKIVCSSINKLVVLLCLGVFFISPAKSIGSSNLHINSENSLSLAALTTPASNVTFSAVNSSSFSISWAKGNGTKRLVFVKQTNNISEIPAPANNTTYTASTAFGSGTQIASSGWYCVYNNNGTTVTITNISTASNYRVAVVECDGGAGTEQYNLNFSLYGNPVTTAPTVQATNVAIINLQNAQMDLSWIRGNGSGCAVFVRAASSGNPSPGSNKTYAANSVYGSGGQAGTGWYCVYKGTGTNVTVTNLSSKTQYQIMVVEFNGNSTYEQYLLTTGTNNPASITTPPTQCSNIVFSNNTFTSATVSWTNGTGNGRAVFIKETTVYETATPVNNTTYTPNQFYSQGSQIGSSGWYCIYVGTGTSVNVYRLTPGKTYRVMACEYLGGAGSESYDTYAYTNNPISLSMVIQASNLVVSNIQPNSFDLSWSRGSGDSCVVFVKQATSGSATPINGTIYYPDPDFASGTQIGSTSWFCVYKGKGTSATVSTVNTALAYQIMVCEFTTSGGNSLYNASTTLYNNPLNKPAAPAAPLTQAYNITFSNILPTSATISWSNGNGNKRAVFIRKTTGIENAIPSNNTTYTASTTYGIGQEIGTSGWYCIYNGTNSSVNIFGLTPDNTYRIMVCEYNGAAGQEQYNTNPASNNPASILQTVQASNVVVSNILPASVDLSWFRGTGDSCAVFVKLANSGNATPINGIAYNASGTFQSGDEIGSTAWFCVYKGKGTSVTVSGLNTAQIYRVMVCEYSNSGGLIQYNISTSQGNPVNTLAAVPSQATNIVFKNITSNYLTVSWSNGGGSNRVVFMKETPLLEAANPYGATYVASSTLGNGSQINSSGWFCVYNGSGTSVNVYGLTPGSTYSVSVCDYNGTAGAEQYNISASSNNPAAIQLILQASNIVVSNIQPTSMDLSWSRGGGDSCAVFVKLANSGNAIPINGINYNPNANFTSGSQIGTSNWYCVYKGKGTSVNVTGLTTNNAYQIMVCEFTKIAGLSFYNTSTALNNPYTKPAVPSAPITPTSQATNIGFNSITSNSVNITWSNGGGSARAVFLKQTTGYEIANPQNNTTYLGNNNFGAGTQIGSSGWFCVYNGNSTSTAVNGLTAGVTYRAMVCEYNGSAGAELYNSGMASGNPASIMLTIQASGISFSNLQPTSNNLSWTRGTGDNVIVFAKQASSGTPTLTNNITYQDNTIFGSGSPDGTGWYCIYKGSASGISVTGLTPNLDYRFFACEYNGTSGAEFYNFSTASGNPANRPLIPTNQANNISFTNITASAMTVNWSVGNGSKKAVFVKKTTGLESAMPDNNSTYNANTVFGSGSEIGNSKWYCVFNGTTSSVTVTGLTAGETYRVMVCEYNGTAGNELYNKDISNNNPNSLQITIQSTSLIFSNVLSTSTSLSWTRGTGTGCLVFAKQGNSGTVSLTNTLTYKANSNFGNGSPDGNGWFCVYNGTGSTASVSGLTPGKDYYFMVCEYTGASGSEVYNSSTASGNPALKPLKPITQANSVVFTSITNNSMVINWSNGNGSKRAVFVKKTTGSETPLPDNNTTYTPSTNFSIGSQIGTSGWYCVYNSNSGSGVTVNNLTPGTTYKVMVCEYNGTAGVEQYNTDLATNNPASVTLTLQSTNVQFKNILSTSMDILWTRGSDNSCVVFVAQATSGNVTLTNNITYTPNTVFGNGSANGSGWFCVYKGTGNNVTVTGLLANTNYRVMVCEYNGSAGSENYNTATATGNPANKTLAPTTQASNVTFATTLLGSTDVLWTRGNGTSCAVFVKMTSAFENAAPVNNTTYNANANYSSGSPIATTGWYCIYNGIGTSVALTGLSASTTYRVMVVEYNGIGNGEQYFTNSGANDPVNITTLSSKANQTITFNALTSRQFGTADFSPGATTTSGLTVTYTSSNTAVATIVNGNIHIVGMGNTTITAYQTGNVNYNAATPVPQSLTVDRGTQGLNFSPLPTKYYENPDFDPGATATSGLPVTYSSNNPSVATIVNNKIHIIGVGTTNISAFQPGDDNFYPASSVFQTLIVAKANQTITFNPLSPMTFKDGDIDPGATASSGLVVNYVSTNTNIATIVGGRIHAVSAGDVNILAIQSGNNYYSAAPNVPRTLTISKADQVITFNPMADMVYDDIFMNPASANSGLEIEYKADNPDVAEILNNKIHIIGAGAVTITATQPGNSSYKAATEVSQILNVLKSSQTVTFNVLPSAVFGDPDIALTATSSSDLPVNYTTDNPGVATIVNGKLHIVGTGISNITASQDGDFRYLPAAVNVTQPFTVTSSNQAISFSSLSAKIYGDADFSITATASSGLTVTFSSDNTSVATVTNGVVHLVGAGTANITASQAGNGFYTRAPYVVHPLVVDKADQSINFSALGAKTYSDADFLVTATASSSLPVSFESDNTAVATVINGVVHIVGAGSANIIAKQVGNSNFNSAPVILRTLTVGKVSQSIVFFPMGVKRYNDSDFNPGAISSTGLPVTYASDNPLVAIVVGENIHITGVGSANITAYQTGNTNYLAAPNKSQTLVVGKANQTVAFNTLPSKPYGSSDFMVSAAASSGLPLTFQSSNFAVATVSGNMVHIVGVGSTSIIATQAGNTEYNSIISLQTLVITRASQSIVFDEISPQDFGNEDYILSAISSSNLPISYNSSNPGVATIVNGVVHITGAGTATITASQMGNTYYDPAPAVSQQLIVNKLSQEIYFQPLDIVTYGVDDFAPGAVSNSPLTIYYSSDNTNVATIKNGKIHVVGAGSANITANQPGDASHDNALDVVRTLVVNKATLIVTADDYTRIYNTANPSFTCSYSGFAYGDNQLSLDGLPNITTTAVTSSNPGKYDLIPQNAFDNNYDMVFVKGYLTILGTYPLKASKPEGKTSLCANPVDQTYTSLGSMFASAYIWTMNPSSAGTISGSGTTIAINFKDDYLGKVSLSVKGKNIQDIGENSDTLDIFILPRTETGNVAVRGSYCSNSNFGDSIILKNSGPNYYFELFKDGSSYTPEIKGNGENLGWYDLKAGTYFITENVCNTRIGNSIEIREVSPTSDKPQLHVKWNDVIVCIRDQDSIINYKWYKNGNLIQGRNDQFLWTKQETGFYYCKTIDDSGCANESDSVYIEPATVVLVYPNPSHGQFKLSFAHPETGKVLLRLSDINGVPLSSLSFQKDNESFEQDIDLQGIPAGSYFIDVFLGSSKIAYKTIIIQ